MDMLKKQPSLHADALVWSLAGDQARLEGG